MAAQAKHRAAILQAAARLFRRQGYAATGMNELIAESGAPKGSIYHYFPGGKAEIGAAAVKLSGQVVAATLDRLADEADGPGALVRMYAQRLTGWMAQSGFRDGCPIATVLLEAAPADDAITGAGQDAFAAWAERLARALTTAGASPERSERLGRFAIAALEGALIQARVAQSAAPINEAVDELAALFDRASGIGAGALDARLSTVQ